MGAQFCDDGELGYERARTRFDPGAGLVLDEAYRLAHLPLVAPGHPRVIASREGSDYTMGRHARVFSLVLPVSAAELAVSDAYKTLERELRSAPFADKIAWNLLERRGAKLHATVCGSLGTGDPPTLGSEVRRELSRIGPIAVEVRGLFSGNVNVGRLYLRVYPERRDGNVLHRIQRALGRAETDLYLVGVYNFVDDLDPGQAAALAQILDVWWHRPLLRFETDVLWLLGATDDLVLDAAVVETIPLTGAVRAG
ncbi:MAG TPA: hypothetical protein VE686_02370 [Beijerinckiaceae bacterium]|nr:hypothetical protein [Beijerinckiaceae bacterium]